MVSIVDGRIETYMIVTWVKLGRPPRSRNDAPTAAFAKDPMYFILGASSGRGPFAREFVTEQVQHVKVVLKLPESADSTFGWHQLCW
ncbi:hypothetical protein EXIGLDRAFT_326300 [Exidia glandulosa HHB12029]|uniref:Uncharacterized protein n=1 Tax=Exidia glandulosa HHB12029 TaxID=1314781 RepID=A0A165CTF5_EXIGL|nr:hypothetical protein EXIGLDRAFT_370545 [Exidia glandulosa HHB12029]KZV83085.1 hypothetical protein EXIGLDRAFT_326300 [Exidia glandulosa HHB12029]